MEGYNSKKILEGDPEENTGYHNFSDAQLSNELKVVRDRINALKNPLDTIESDRFQEEFGATHMQAEEIKTSEITMMELKIKELEKEYERRSLLN